jgi:putative transposase
MSERYKVFDPCRAYFITFTTINWIRLFEDSRYAAIIIDSIKYCQQYKGLVLYAYCIMPSHIHLIAQAEHGNLPDIIRDIKKYTSALIIKFLQADTARKDDLQKIKMAGQLCERNKKHKVWQDGFHPEIIVTNKFFYQKLKYIHQNPVEGRIVSYAEDYAYSSARNYAGLEAVLPVIIESQMQVTYR